MDIRAYNRDAWDQKVATGDRWTLPVSAEVVARARRGDVQVLLTPVKLVPPQWLGELADRDVLGLACGGGQQCPQFAAAGARVTVFDNSPKQLGQDRMVAEREGLEIATVEGDMRDLSAFADESFDLIFHPVSNCFSPEVLPVWQEAQRVLRPGGALLAGFMNPVNAIFDVRRREAGELVAKYRVPVSDLHSLSDEERQVFAGEPLEVAHSLQDQIGGQLDAGLMLAGMYEDEAVDELIDRHLPVFIATRAVKPKA